MCRLGCSVVWTSVEESIIGLRIRSVKPRTFGRLNRSVTPGCEGRVDQEDALTGLGDDDREVRRGHRLALPRHRAGDQQRSDRLVDRGELQVRPAACDRLRPSGSAGTAARPGDRTVVGHLRRACVRSSRGWAGPACRRPASGPSTHRRDTRPRRPRRRRSGRRAWQPAGHSVGGGMGSARPGRARAGRWSRGSMPGSTCTRAASRRSPEGSRSGSATSGGSPPRPAVRSVCARVTRICSCVADYVVSDRREVLFEDAMIPPPRPDTPATLRSGPWRRVRDGCGGARVCVSCRDAQEGGVRTPR